jgi:hypothetical protein
MNSLTLLLLLVLCVYADQEHSSHGSPSKTFQQDHEGNGHNPDLDHQAILGSRKLAHEFDDLSPEESKKRLRVSFSNNCNDFKIFRCLLTEWM